MARDEFTKTTIQKLRDRVSNRCSNPECRVPTSASAGKEKVNSVGVAAHICAASIGGPRFDPNMTRQDRKSLANGIWLCSNCSIIIDRDIELYTEALLQDWKRTCERLAIEEIGKKLPGKNDALDTLTTALSGHPKKFLAQAIENIHKASKESLEKLDPRFTVDTEFSNHGISYRLNATKLVLLDLIVKKEYGQEYSEKYTALIRRGEDLKITADAISFKGSKLIEELLNDKKGTIVIGSRKLEAVQKHWLVNPASGQKEHMDDVKGEISLGSELYSFEGETFGKALKYSYSVPLEGKSSRVSITINSDVWDGLDLRCIPFFDRMKTFFSMLAEGWELFIALEVQGNRLFTSQGVELGAPDFYKNVKSYFDYLSDCRKISCALDQLIKYKDQYISSVTNRQEIRALARSLGTEKVYGRKDLKSNPRINLIVNEDCQNIILLNETKAPGFMAVVSNGGYPINVLGQDVVLPPEVTEFDSVIPRVERDLSEIREGDTVVVELVMAENFRCTIKYDLGRDREASEL